MSRLRLQISMSLDGFVAGPDQSVANPIGVGGMAFTNGSPRSPPGARCTASKEARRRRARRRIEEIQANVGAGIMGRNMFGGQRGPWDPQ